MRAMLIRFERAYRRWLAHGEETRYRRCIEAQQSHLEAAERARVRAIVHLFRHAYLMAKARGRI